MKEISSLCLNERQTLFTSYYKMLAIRILEMVDDGQIWLKRGVYDLDLGFIKPITCTIAKILKRLRAI